MRSVSIADDMEISVKSLINRKPKRVGSRGIARSFIGLEPLLIARSMNCSLKELNAARAAISCDQESLNTTPSSLPACASQRHR
jgi:hypothetical protein